MAQRQGFTPGPWEAEYTNGRGYGGALWAITRMVGNTRATIAGTDSEANARLISAAPDLLAACETLVPSLKWEEKRSGTTYHGYEQAQDAIRKARGEGE